MGTHRYTPKNSPRRRNGQSLYDVYQRRRRRQAIVVVVGLMLLTGIGFGINAGIQSAGPVLHTIASAIGQYNPLNGLSASQAQAADSPPATEIRELTPPDSVLYNAALSENTLLPVSPGKEDVELEAKLNALFDQYRSRFTPHVYFYDPQKDTYVNIAGDTPVAAASVIKVPVLLEFFRAIDQDRLEFNQPLLYTEYHKASGAGELQYTDSGKVIPAYTVATNMIQISDNTCTNMLIDTLGGSDRVNTDLRRLGLRNTYIRNWLPDLEGTNKISMADMTQILLNTDRGVGLTPLSRLEMLGILKGTHNKRLIPALLPKETPIAHKTGDIGTALADVGIVYLPDGRRYIMAIQVDRPYNDYTAREIIQQASKIIYDHTI